MLFWSLRESCLQLPWLFFCSAFLFAPSMCSPQGVVAQYDPVEGRAVIQTTISGEKHLVSTSKAESLVLTEGGTCALARGGRVSLQGNSGQGQLEGG